jgi:hypothetical protein
MKNNASTHFELNGLHTTRRPLLDQDAGPCVVQKEDNWQQYVSSLICWEKLVPRMNAGYISRSNRFSLGYEAACMPNIWGFKKKTPTRVSPSRYGFPLGPKEPITFWCPGLRWAAPNYFTPGRSRDAGAGVGVGLACCLHGKSYFFLRSYIPFYFLFKYLNKIAILQFWIL